MYTTPPNAIGGPSRSYLVGTTEWIVLEDADSPHGPSLVFFGPGVARRVTRYPKHWRELPDAELHLLSWGR